MGGQGEGGEQGDAMMSLLFSFDQHRALEVARRLTPGEHFLAFLDDNFFVSPPHRAGPIYDLFEVSLWRNAGIRIHVGHNCGIVQEPGPLCANRLERGPLKLSTVTLECGGDLCCPLIDKASKSLGLH